MSVGSPRDKPLPGRISDLQKHILESRHPFENCNFITSKFLSAPHRAIMFFLRQSRGGATEYQILDFLTQNWRDITEITPHTTIPTPTINFVRFCICVQRAGYFIFTRKEGGLISVYGDDPNDPMPQPVTITEPKPVLQSGPTQIPFEEYMWSLFKSHPHGLTEAQLLEMLVNVQHAPGQFSYLEYDRRIKACLLVIKAENKVTVNRSLRLWIPVLN
jgi:hypothetical protein